VMEIMKANMNEKNKVVRKVVPKCPKYSRVLKTKKADKRTAAVKIEPFISRLR